MLLWVGTGLAATVDETQLAAFVRQVAPAVEAEAGRRFEALPTARIGTRDEVYTHLLASQKLSSIAAGVPVRAGVEREYREFVRTAMAVYTRDDDAVWLVKETLEEGLAAAAFSRDALEPVIRCTVAHELTHALQNRYATPHAPPGDGADTERARLEGQAALVARRVCRRTERAGAARMFEALGGNDVLLDAGDSDAAFFYQLGPVYIADLEAHGGREAVWTALEGPPPPEDELRRIATARLGPSWAGSPGLDAVMRGTLPAGDVSAVAGSPHLLLARLLAAGHDPATFDHVPAVLGGEVGLWTADHTGAELVRLFVEDPAAARAWAEERATLVAGAFERPLDEDAQLAPILVRPHLVEHPERRVPGALFWAAGQDGARFSELWALQGNVLVGVAAAARAGTEELGRARFSAAVRAALDTPVAPAVADLPALLAGDAPPDPPRGVPLSPMFVGEPAMLAYLDGDAGQCADRVARLAGATEMVSPLALLGWTCALDAGDLTRAEKVLELVPAADRPLPLLLDHATLLADARRYHDAQVLLAGAVAQTSEQKRTLADFRLTLALTDGDAAAVLPLATDEDADPELRWAAGGWLADHHRIDAALTVLRPLCGRIDAAAECRAFVAGHGR